MKNINIFTRTAIIVVAIIISSCNDFLDLNPVSDYNAGSFYSKQSDFKLAVNGAYDKLQDLYKSYIVHNIESRSDNVSVFVGYDPGKVSQFIDDATTPDLLSIWDGFWVLISRCNAIIDQIDNGVFDNEAYRSYYKGEAYFLRGYAYFQLGWLYGGMPLVDRQMKVDEIKHTARSTQDETFAFAANDLSQAAQLLPEQWSSAELGKATKYAAEGILARLYLFQKKYANAKPFLADIISSGKYEMATSYVNCFLDKYDNSPEHLFQIQFTVGGEGNTITNTLVPEGTAGFPLAGSSRWLNVTDDLYKSYEKGDLRRDITIQKGYTNKRTGQKDTITCLYVKYAHGTLGTTSDGDNVNLPILRYTDVKLMYAEVLNEEGYNSNGEAFTIINQVRSRAGLSALTSAKAPNQSAFRSAIFQERRSEFACEYLRWFDVLRSGNALTIMNNFLSRADQGSGKYQMKDYQTIFAIPQDELNNNPDTKYMWQNPGY